MLLTIRVIENLARLFRLCRVRLRYESDDSLNRSSGMVPFNPLLSRFRYCSFFIKPISEGIVDKRLYRNLTTFVINDSKLSLSLPVSAQVKSFRVCKVIDSRRNLSNQLVFTCTRIAGQSFSFDIKSKHIAQNSRNFSSRIFPPTRETPYRSHSSALVSHLVCISVSLSLKSTMHVSVALDSAPQTCHAAELN